MALAAICAIFEPRVGLNVGCDWKSLHFWSKIRPVLKVRCAVVKWLSKDQLVETLEEKLEASHISEPIAREFAQEFLDELERGNTLTFSDVGVIQLNQDTVRIESLPKSARSGVIAFATGRDHETLLGNEPTLLTLEGETSVRALVRGGYSRREAESALLMLEG